MGSEDSQKFDVDNEAQEEWEDNDWEDGDVVSEEDVLSASELKEKQKKIDIEKAKVRRSIEEFREQKRLRELLGDEFDEFDD
jgi:hypothetical protein